MKIRGEVADADAVVIVAWAAPGRIAMLCAEAAELDACGMAFDFSVLKRELDSVLDELDHRNLNETPPFDLVNPSSEHIARMVFEALQARLPDAHLRYVEAWESPDAWATYTPD